MKTSRLVVAVVAAAFCAAAFFLAGGIVLAWKLVFPEWPRNAVIASCAVPASKFLIWI